MRILFIFVIGIIWINYPETAEARTVSPLLSYVHQYNTCNMNTRFQNTETNFYNRVHWFLKKNKPKPECEFCGEKYKKLEHALKKGCVYDFNLDNFLVLCGSCHRRYDFTEELGKKRSVNMKGNNYAAGRLGAKHHQSKAVQKIDKVTGEILAEYGSTGEAGRHEKYVQTSISDICRGRYDTGKKITFTYKYR